MDKLDYIPIDFETANYFKNSACSVGLVRFINGIEHDSFYSLIKPAKLYFIPEWTRDIHHISYSDVMDKPAFPEIWNKMVMPFINQTPGIPLVAHNSSFDMGVISGCCEYFGISKPGLEYFDSLCIARKTWPELTSHKLTSLGEYFNIEYNAHDALEDSRTCGIIIKKAAEKWKTNNLKILLNKCSVGLKSL